MLDFTPEERLRAFVAMADCMLVELWVAALGEHKAPLEEGEFFEQRVVDAIEHRFANTSARESEVTQSLALEHAMALWGLIKAHLAKLDGETPQVQQTRRGPTGVDGDPNGDRPPEPDAPPDRE